MRKVDLSKLPHGGLHIPKNKINWKDSIGYKINFEYDNIIGEFSIINYDGKHIYIKYLNNPIFKIRPGDFCDGSLGGILGIKVYNYKFNINEIIQNKLLILECFRIGQGKHIHKAYKYKCLKCGNIDTIRETQLINNVGCNTCCKSPRNPIEGYNDIPTTASWMIKYFQGGYDEAKNYSIGSSKIINFICPNCNNVKSKRISSLFTNGLMCNKCSDGISIPNKIMFNILEQLNIKFQTEYSPKWISPKKYDFYFKIGEKKYIIEMDGGFHFKDNNLTGDKFDEIKAIDDYKNLKALENKIEIIRINCDYKNNNEFNYIKNNILISNLSKILNLSIIDWNKVFLFSITSRVHDACNLWNNGNTNIINISKIMILSQDTIRKYLKKGKELNICTYDPKISKMEGLKKTIQKNKSRSKKIICLNNNKIFTSSKEASEYAKTCKENILNCCNGKYLTAGFSDINKEYYQWQYYDDFLNNPKTLLTKDEIINKYNKLGYVKSMIEIMCLNTNEIFKSINEASSTYNISNTNISANCKYKQCFAGKHPVTKEKLVWVYYKEYLKMSKEQILYLIQKPNNKQKRILNYKKIICLNTNQIFNSVQEASNKTMIHNISKCCLGKSKSAGKHPETGKPLKWMYYDDYIKEQEELNKKTILN